MRHTCSAVTTVRLAPLRRRLLKLVTALSLLLCATTVVLWVRSGYGPTAIEVVTSRGVRWQFWADRLNVGVQRVRGWPEAPGIRYTGYSYAHGLRGSSLALLDFAARGGARSTGREGFGCSLWTGTVRVLLDDNGRVWRGPPFPGPVPQKQMSAPRPYWTAAIRQPLALAAFATLPAARLLLAARRRLKRRAHRRRGRCPQCGYDLTANVSGVCPECGTETARQ